MHKIDPYWEDLPGAAGIRLRPHRGSQPGPCSLPAGSRAVTQVIEKRDAAAALQAFMDLYGAVGELPLCQLYRKDLRFFGKMQVEYMQRRWTSFKDGENRSTALEQKQRPGDMLRVSIVPYRLPMVHFWDL